LLLSKATAGKRKRSTTENERGNGEIAWQWWRQNPALVVTNISPFQKPSFLLKINMWNKF
jgi:hypothetical protein